MDWYFIIYIGVGFLLGHGLFLARHAKRNLRGSEEEAMRMYSASLRSLAQRTAQLAQISTESLAESDEEKMFKMGMAKAQELLARELNKMAENVES